MFAVDQMINESEDSRSKDINASRFSIYASVGKRVKNVQLLLTSFVSFHTISGHDKTVTHVLEIRGKLLHVKGYPLGTTC